MKIYITSRFSNSTSNKNEIEVFPGIDPVTGEIKNWIPQEYRESLYQEFPGLVPFTFIRANVFSHYALQILQAKKMFNNWAMDKKSENENEKDRKEWK
jgi:hypothetical protein